MRIPTLALALLCISACGGDGSTGMDRVSDLTPLEATLQANSDWPYETVGVLDIVEAGYDGSSDEPQWAVGMLLAGGEEFGPLIEIDGKVISRAGINIDSGEEVRVWLEAPKDNYGLPTYPISKIE